MKELILAFLGSLFPAILFNAGKNKFLWVGFSGTIGWIVYAWLLGNTGQVILSTFAGAVAVGLYSECAARKLKSPATVFSVAGIFPLVPGIGAYQTVQYIVESKLAEAASKAVETVTSAGAIALGIMLMSGVFRVMTKIREKNST